MTKKNLQYTASALVIFALVLMNIASSQSIFSLPPADSPMGGNPGATVIGGTSDDINSDEEISRIFSRMNYSGANDQSIDITIPVQSESADFDTTATDSTDSIEAAIRDDVTKEPTAPELDIKVLAVTNGPQGPTGLISINGSSQYVRIGDTVDKQYRVAEINEDGVKLIPNGT